MDEEKNVKKILIWTGYYRASGLWGKVFRRHCLGECEEKRCLITTNKKESEEADAILFDGNSLQRKIYGPGERRFLWPSSRKENQIYIFFSTEPPTRFSKIDLEAFDDFFNWTMTFRRDSDVVIPFGRVLKEKVKGNISEVSQQILDRKKIGIWLNSHCAQNSPRIEFMNELRKHIPIHVFGRCVNRKCGTKATIRFVKELGMDTCEKTFGDYVFFMALENSLCKDYVTEKIFRSLKLDIIPVVFGSANYSEFAPPKSYIDSSTFPTIADLASFMKMVSGNVSLYNEFFQWKEDYEIDIGSPYKPLICDLCKKLHSQDPPSSKKWYKSIKDWWITGSHCTSLDII
ncbi:UNVERIFIED_CONTAM: hypothetical protein RMT77_004922 [Armadillidium vulgare]